jgi:hypothetical protein
MSGLAASYCLKGASNLPLSNRLKTVKNGSKGLKTAFLSLF